MSNAVIGALRVVFGADTAAFEKGVDQATRKANSFEKGMKRLGGKIGNVGKTITAGITTPVLGAATAFGVAAHRMAGEAREIATSADVAGESFEKFQRQAHAAKTVGVEFEKLGDIFKDVRDRVGDFAATGGGPMADFFENIAPKVGVTAEAFKGLSGKDSLQLYFDSLRKANVSQEEMVFYMEAMASDATNLIPLLEQNGAAFDKLGKSANVITDEERAHLDRYTQAQKRLGEATKKLTIALVESGILDTITDLVDRFAEFTSNLAETNPTLLKVGVIFAGIAAAIGPVLIAFGSLVSIAPGLGAFALGLAGIGPAGGIAATGATAAGLAIRGLATSLLGLLLNPVFLGAAAVIGGIYLAWQNWDKIKPYITAVRDAVVGFWNDSVKPIFDQVMEKVRAVADFFGDYFGDQIKNTVRLVSSLMRGDFQGAWDAAQSIVSRHIQAIVGVIGDLPQRAIGFFVQLHVDIVNWGAGMLRTMASIGVDMLRGLIEGIKSRASAVYDTLVGTVQESVARVKNFLGIASPSRLFMEIGQNVGEGFAVGLRDSAPMVSSAMNDLALTADDMSERTGIAAQGVSDNFKSMADSVLGSVRGLVDGIKSGDFFSILEGVIGLFGSVAGTGAFGGGLQSAFAGPSFEGGGFTGRGSRAGGMDGRGGFLAMLHPNETVIDHTRGGSNDNSPMQISVEASPYFDVRVNGQIQQAAPRIAKGGSQLAHRDMRAAATRRVR